ncbi:oligosaccharide flippase family protein [Eubacteriales bacterium OttesenSCG-928-M02]|nr:oligosaccharide flippase family protein [Eubacteriales bacterium OttesenSCG-928-M02]
MRSKNSIKNGIAGLMLQIVLTIMGFVIRKLIVEYLSMEMVGYSTLFGDILRWLNFAEMGVGVSVAFHLYKPVEEQDYEKINALMSIYRRIYHIIGYAVASLGLLLMVFLPYLVSGQTVDNTFLRLIFFVELTGVTATYFLAYYRTIYYSSQMDYICMNIDAVLTVIFTVVRLICIVLLRNYVLYLAASIIQNIAAGLIIYQLSKKYFPKLNAKQSFDKSLGKLIMKDTRNIFFSKISNLIYSSTDNILISRFVGIVNVGSFGSYNMIFSTVLNYIQKFFAGASASIGNLVNTQDDKVYAEQVFRRYNYICCAVLPFVTTSFLLLTDTFMGNIWMGKEYTLDFSIVVMMTLNYAMNIMHIPLSTFITGLGYFVQDRNLSIVGSAINLITSIVLVFPLGIAGVLLGTLISQLFFSIARPIVLFHEYFMQSSMVYWKMVLPFLLITLISVVGSYGLSVVLFAGFPWWAAFIGKIIVCAILPNALMIMVSYKSDAFLYYKDIIKQFFSKDK